MTTRIENQRIKIKHLLYSLILFLLLIALWLIYKDINVFPMADFSEYWASGRINIQGGNPYDPAQMFALEQTVGWSEDHALMMLNPPWTLAYAMFWGMFSYSFSRFLCFILQIAIVFICSTLVWRIYRGNKHHEWTAWVVMLTFGPALHALRSGQVTILVLLGAVGFLYFLEKDRDFWAGAFASLVLAKPHLLFLFVLAVILWSLSQHRYRIVLGMLAGLVGSTCIVWLVNPQIISQYIDMLRFYPLENWMTSTLGAFLRIRLAPDLFYLQVVPALLGVIWFMIFWIRNHMNFEWHTGLPLIVLISIVISPYGWTLDFTVTAISVIYIAVLFEFKRWILAKGLIFISYWIANLLIAFYSASQNWFWWFPSFLLIWFLFSNRYLARNRQSLLPDDLAINTR